jgi:hypothetical protein
MPNLMKETTSSRPKIILNEIKKNNKNQLILEKNNISNKII